MEFWRIYRLVFARRNLILATMLIAAVVIFAGTALQAQKREFQSEATLQPQDVVLPQVVQNGENGVQTTSTAPSNAGADETTNISNLIMILRTSNDLYGKTADLLREDEGLREIEVQRILERNGYFIPLTTDIQTQAKQMVDKGQMTPKDVDAWTTTRLQSAEQNVVNQFAQGRDASGDFAAAGLKLSKDEIADRIRQNLSFDTVAGPLSTDNAPQIANQIRITSKFEREAEANLYVNLICVEFLDFYSNTQASAANARIARLQDEYDAAKDRLAKARATEVAFRDSHGISVTSDTTITETEKLQSEQLQLQGEVSGAQATVSVLESALRSSSVTETTALPATENPEVRVLQAQYDEAESAFNAIAGSNEGAANNDKFIAAKSRLDAARLELKTAKEQPYTTSSVNINVDSLRAKLVDAQEAFNSAKQRLDTLDQQIANYKEKLTKLPAAQSELTDLHREVLSADQDVSGLAAALQREKIDKTEYGKAGTITIVSEAHTLPIVSGISKQRAKLIVYGMVLALLFSVGLIIALDTLDNSIRTGEDLEKLTGLPVAGIIPEHFPDPIRSPRIALIEPLSAATEAYRMLRTDLLFTAAEHPFQSLLLATARPGQGGTTTLCNLAIVLAQSGKRVILVDADLRNPKLHTIFRVSNDLGLTAVLSDQCPLDEALIPTEVERLTLLPAGQFVLNPSDVLGSDRMIALHNELKEIADYVLYDTPAAIAYSDTALLSSFVDATLLVVRASTIPRGTEDQVRALLTKARANLIGVVLNGVAPEEVNSVHYHSDNRILPASAQNGFGRSNDAFRAPLPPYAGTNDHNGRDAGNTSSANNGHDSSQVAGDPVIGADHEIEGDPDLMITLPGEERQQQQTAGLGHEATMTRPAAMPAASSMNTESAANAVTPALPAPRIDSRKDARPFASPAPQAHSPFVRKKRQSALAKTILIVVVGGLVLGGLVLLLGVGASVK